MLVTFQSSLCTPPPSPPYIPSPAFSVRELADCADPCLDVDSSLKPLVAGPSAMCAKRRRKDFPGYNLYVVETLSKDLPSCNRYPDTKTLGKYSRSYNRYAEKQTPNQISEELYPIDMGRGLSNLQRWILVEAASQRPIKRAEPRPVACDMMKTHFPQIAKRMAANKGNGVDLYYWEVMDRFFNIRTRHRKLRAGLDGWRAFATREYKCAAAALSRSIGRLEHRGLVAVYHGTFSRWAGIRLTELGISEALKHGKRKRRLEKDGSGSQENQGTKPSELATEQRPTQVFRGIELKSDSGEQIRRRVK